MREEIQGSIRDLQSGFDRMIDAWINGYRLLGGEIFCADRCSDCCTLAVNCSWGESLCIADSLAESQALRLRDHVRLLRSVLAKSTDFRSFLKMHRQEIGFCPFLTDGSCSIYPVRPCSCRSLLATKENRWCGADFSAMTREERQCFVESLDRGVVAFPMHYVAATQEMGQRLEVKSAELMGERYGFSVYGNLPLLVHLTREYGLSDIVAKGYSDTLEFLEGVGLNHPFLISLTEYPSK